MGPSAADVISVDHLRQLDWKSGRWPLCSSLGEMAAAAAVAAAAAAAAAQDGLQIQ